jgi:hypothetical protein
MTVTSFAQRCRWYVRALGRNPLIRVADRLEAFTILGVLTLALVAVPVAQQAGDTAYEARMQTATEQAHTRHTVDAVVVEGSTGMPADFDSPAYVRVQWREGTHTRTEQVVSPATVKEGEPLKVWLDDAGKVVGPPVTRVDARVSAIGAAWIVWSFAVLLSALLAVAICRGLDRARARAWERELILLAHNDDGWANRRS